MAAATATTGVAAGGCGAGVISTTGAGVGVLATTGAGVGSGVTGGAATGVVRLSEGEGVGGFTTVVGVPLAGVDFAALLREARGVGLVVCA